jgi:hypothetical protein
LENDFVSDEEFDRLLDAWFGNVARVMKPGGVFYIWGGYANFVNYPRFLKKHEIYFSQAIVWLKEHPVLTRKDFLGDHEWCFYGWKLGAAHKFYGPNNITDTWQLSKDHDGNCAIGSGVRLNFPDGSRLDVLPPSDKHRVRDVEFNEDNGQSHRHEFYHGRLACQEGQSTANGTPYAKAHRTWRSRFAILDVTGRECA